MRSPEPRPVARYALQLLVTLMLRVYPRSFRLRWGDEMRATFFARLRGVSRTPAAAVALLLRELAGFLHAGLRTRFSPAGRPRPHHREDLMDTLRRDLRLSSRALRRNPMLSLSVICVAGIGIGAATAIFSAVDAALLRPLPLRQPGRLVMVWEQNPELGWYKQTAAPANYLDWREQVPAFRDAAAYADFVTSLTLSGTGEPERIRTRLVTGNFFEVLGRDAALGRVLREHETWSDAARVVVISDAFWQRRFGRDPGALGATLSLDGESYEIVGVMPAGFEFPGGELDAWLPFRWDPGSMGQASFRRAHYVRVVARLENGVSHAQAEEQLRTVARSLEEQHPQLNRLMGAGLTPLQEFLVGDSRTPLLLVFAATALLLLLTCVNVANLLLVRAAAGRRDLAVRTALGAGAGRLVRQVLTESLLLAVLGGLLGIALASAVSRGLASLAPPDLAGLHGVALDTRVLAFAILLTLLTGCAFGLLPALRNAHVHPGEALREGARAAGGRRPRRTSGLLVASEVALTVLIVGAAGLLVRSFLALRSVDPGFRTDSRATGRIALPASRYDNADRILPLLDELELRLEALPGVNAVTFTNRLPLTRQGYTSNFRVRGEPRYGTEVVHRTVAHDYFDVLGVPLLAGRSFHRDDAPGSERVVIINDVLRREHFGAEDPLGRLLAFEREPGDQATWYRIIGVVGSERQNGLSQPPRIEIFESARQDVRRELTLVLQTSVDPASVIPAVRRTIMELDAAVPLFDVQTLDDVHAAALARDRFLLLLITCFASVALILAALGVYGVAAEAARHRTREIGIRVALGATRPQLLWLVLRQAATLVAAGAAVGLAAGLLSARLASEVLFAVQPRDPLTFVLVPIIVVATALLASWLPARKAARLDAARALRSD